MWILSNKINLFKRIYKRKKQLTALVFYVNLDQATDVRPWGDKGCDHTLCWNVITRYNEVCVLSCQWNWIRHPLGGKGWLFLSYFCGWLNWDLEMFKIQDKLGRGVCVEHFSKWSEIHLYNMDVLVWDVPSFFPWIVLCLCQLFHLLSRFILQSSVKKCRRLYWLFDVEWSSSILNELILKMWMLTIKERALIIFQRPWLLCLKRHSLWFLAHALFSV